MLPGFDCTPDSLSLSSSMPLKPAHIDDPAKLSLPLSLRMEPRLLGPAISVSPDPREAFIQAVVFKEQRTPLARLPFHLNKLGFLQSNG